MRAHLLLADYAEVKDSKLYVVGGGWSRATRQRDAPIEMAVVLILKTETGEVSQLEVDFQLQEENGSIIEIDGQKIQVRATGIAERKPDTVDVLPSYIFLTFRLAVSLPPRLYRWVALMNGETIAEEPFQVNESVAQPNLPNGAVADA